MNVISDASSKVDAVKTIWDTLSKVNVNEHIEKKSGFSYLSWAWAWGILMDKFPDARFSFDADACGNELFRYTDGSSEVRCVLTINGVSRMMWLPVMDNRNNAIKNPDARAVNDAKMRCLVKAMALFGLGHYIYAGEDVPEAPKVDAVKPEQNTNDASVDLVKAMTAAATLDDLKVAFTKAQKYAKNRNDEALLSAFVKLKDDVKTKLAA